MLYFQGKTVSSYLQWIIAPLMLGGLLFFSHCNPADRYQYHYPISQETKDYCYFKEGSWWVYVDSNRMVYDTVRCVRSTMSKLNHSVYTNFPLETMLCNFESSSYGLIGYQNIGTGIVDTLKVSQLIDVVSPPSYDFFIHFYSSKNLDSIEYDSKIMKKVSLVINGFHDVLSFETTGFFASELPKKIAWAPHVGIVYKAMPDGANWELIDYEVFQP